jgi:hypothetical protein
MQFHTLQGKNRLRLGLAQVSEAGLQSPVLGGWGNHVFDFGSNLWGGGQSWQQSCFAHFVLGRKVIYILKIVYGARCIVSTHRQLDASFGKQEY